MNELTIQKLLDGDIDPVTMREELLAIGRRTAWEPFLEVHHVEPERVETINLTRLQHLAIHICVAMINPTSKHHAQVAAFVKRFPNGQYPRILIEFETPGLRDRVLSFGQRRPDTAEKSIAHARTFIDYEKNLEALKERGRLLGSRPCTYKDQVSTTLKSKPLVTCEICGTQVKDIGGNLLQHQRSPKCVPPEKIVMSCIYCGRGFRSHFLGPLLQHQRSSKCQKST